MGWIDGPEHPRCSRCGGNTNSGITRYDKRHSWYRLVQIGNTLFMCCQFGQFPDVVHLRWWKFDISSFPDRLPPSPDNCIGKIEILPSGKNGPYVLNLKIDGDIPQMQLPDEEVLPMLERLKNPLQSTPLAQSIPMQLSQLGPQQQLQKWQEWQQWLQLQEQLLQLQQLQQQLPQASQLKVAKSLTSDPLTEVTEIDDILIYQSKHPFRQTDASLHHPPSQLSQQQPPVQLPTHPPRRWLPMATQPLPVQMATQPLPEQMATQPLPHSDVMKELGKSTVEVSQVATVPLKRKAKRGGINAANKKPTRPPPKSAFDALLAAARIPNCDDSDTETESDSEDLHICVGDECTHRGCNGH